MFEAKIQVNRIILMVLLAAIVAGLFCYLAQLTNFYEKLNALQQTLTASENERIRLAKEKEKLIAEKETLNAEVGNLNAKLVQLQGLLDQSNIDKTALQGEIKRMTEELSALKEDLRLWEGKISDLSEVELIIANKNKSITEMRKRVKDLKEKAQREIDQFKSEFGNHGYVVKDSKTTLVRDRMMEFDGKVKRVDLKKIIVKPNQEKVAEPSFAY